MTEREKKWNWYCSTVRESGLEPIPYALFDRIVNLDPVAQYEYTDWFWNDRGNYHE
ncbi:hypothetical protein QB910_000107 [Dabrowskivirus KKP3916]|uniref:Uncharacterized protein n=1 Tax=Alicyclobacillus phage KKP_3916 TaxID=3040651 RepID=A0AAT9V8D3_9CAUD|nr:hypothetical protein QB910_000107 [Alicyclobacillus phage KKP 3916]